MDIHFAVDKLINPTLYYALKDVFWHVRVERPGEAMQRQYVQHLCDDGVVRLRMQVIPGGQGEQFCVCCRACGDTKFRLRINHRWGIRDKLSRSRNLWLLNCFNEGCYRGDYSMQRDFYDLVYVYSSASGSGAPAETALRPGVPGQARQFGPPGPFLTMDDLIRRNPNHDALKYLRNRLVDPMYAYRTFGIIYCLTSEYPYTSNRLIIPIERRGTLIGWQARALYDPKKEDGVPKYYTGPGSDLSSGFNLEQACQYHTKVIVEGAFDVLGVGRQGWALLGKTLSHAKLKNLKTEVGRYCDLGAFVVVLDPDQPEKERLKGLPHQIETAYATLAKEFGAQRVAKVYLPSGMDPGSMVSAQLWSRISKLSAEQGVTVSRELLTPT
ncbi:MAG TPA: hypothetical protein VMP01_27155 [Pirellulaceae bacterium]|nr:hypothetical protein [Pirellulaceae bacterium]